MACCCNPLLGRVFSVPQTEDIDGLVNFAGGNVNAELRFSMWWDSWSDVDFHLTEPSGNHIYFSNKSGKLDVDMNVDSTERAPTATHHKPAVENISFAEYSRDAADGIYKMGYVQYGVWGGRAVNADAPKFLITRRWNDDGTMRNDTLLLQSQKGNLAQDRARRINIATFEKQGERFTLVALAPGVVIERITGDKISLAEPMGVASELM